MTFPQRQSAWTRSVSDVFRSYAIRWERYRRRGASACLRCGRPAGVNCHACSALVCGRCWVLSIETGAALPLCLDCVSPSRPSAPALRSFNPGEVFRSGARALVVVVSAAVGFGYWRHGWAGAWSVIATLLHPTVTLGLVPMAFLLGAVRSVVLATARAVFRSFGSSA